MRLVDADKIDLDYSGLAHISPYDFIGTAKYFADQIKSMSTVDAVEVVRCKGCKYSKLYTYGGIEELFCECDDFMRNPNDFCSHGERKEATE